MATLAAHLTPRGPGAIATVTLCGPSARRILSDIFQPASSLPQHGCLAVGKIIDDGMTIDQAVVACEEEDSFAINCHGSPLVVEMLMEALSRHGAGIVEPRVLQHSRLARDTSLNSIAVEAHLEGLSALTLEGAMLIANQASSGLAPLALRWASLLSDDTLAAIQAEAAKALERWMVGQLVIHGARVVLAGPPNSGKSTLLNALAGRSMSIVADEPGTTRDYVSARFMAGALAMEVIDTAGLDAATHCSIDAAAQERSRRLLDSADLVIIVLDSTRDAGQFEMGLLEGRPSLALCNKSDIGHLDIPGAIHISAARGTNIDAVTVAIGRKLGTDGFDPTMPAPFTARQKGILERLAHAAGTAAARGLITELLNGPVPV